MTKEKKAFKIKNKITGFVFNLLKEDCDRLVKEEPYNFEVIDTDYVAPAGEVEKTTTYNQIVDEEILSKEALEVKTVAQLTEMCKNKDIEIGAGSRKADLIDKLLTEVKD